MTEWCQNKDCCYKKNQNQMRGTKGHKYYQSNKAHYYYFDMFCSQGCFHNYFKEHSRRILDTIGEIKRQTIGVDDAWQITSEWNSGVQSDYRDGSDEWFAVGGRGGSYTSGYVPAFISGVNTAGSGGHGPSDGVDNSTGTAGQDGIVIIRYTV